jgi:hypothetical protein
MGKYSAVSAGMTSVTSVMMQAVCLTETEGLEGKTHKFCFMHFKNTLQDFVPI